MTVLGKWCEVQSGDGMVVRHRGMFAGHTIELRGGGGRGINWVGERREQTGYRLAFALRLVHPEGASNTRQRNLDALTVGPRSPGWCLVVDPKD